MDPNKQFGIFLILIICIIGCIIIILLVDDKVVRYVSSSFIGVLGVGILYTCLLYTSPSPRDRQKSRMPSSA